MHTDYLETLAILQDPLVSDTIQLKTILSFVYKCFKINDFESLDNLLLECSNLKLSNLVGVALVRHTLEYKDRLVNWLKCACRVNETLNEKSLNLVNFNINCVPCC